MCGGPGAEQAVGAGAGLTSACTQVVRVLIVVLHRQWLTVRRAGRASWTAPQRRTVRCLRDAVLLLHSLSQRDKLFAVHCVGVLHQFDQALPGVSALLRGLPDLTGCEGERGSCLRRPQPGQLVACITLLQ